jgi:hypothetical protein
MSEIYPSVRTSIRHSVLQALYERPGAWLSTHDLLALVEEAESSDVLARILSDMAATGRLAKGAKTQNAKGQACNTWGLSPAWRHRLAVENTWQDHTGQAAAAPPLPADSIEDEAPAAPTDAQLADVIGRMCTAARAIRHMEATSPLPAESREDEAPIPPAHVGYTLPAATLTSTGTPASPSCITQGQRATSQAAGLCDFAAVQPPFAWLLAEPDAPESPAPKAPEPPQPA